jgi:hypothetical protein
MEPKARKRGQYVHGPEGESTKEAFMTYADLGKSVPLTEKIVAKYLGDLSTPMAKRMVDGVRNDSTVLVEISPLYFSTWDHSKMKH